MNLLNDTTTVLDSLERCDRNRLIQAYARLRHGKLWRISPCLVESLQVGFDTVLGEMRSRYTGVDFDDPKVLGNLQHRADAWWNAKGVKGEGVDW